VADTQTIGRIGEMLKNVYADGVVQLQNQATVIRKKFKKAKAVRVSGDHYEMDVRVGGNRGAVGARNSDDPMPVAKRQRHKKARSMTVPSSRRSSSTTRTSQTPSKTRMPS
jgi:hypothetical protein